MCLSPLIWQLAFFQPNFQTRSIQACCPNAALGRHAQYTRAAPKRLPLVLGVGGAEGPCSNASKCKITTTHNHHYHHHHHHRRRRRRRRHHHSSYLLKVLIVARVIFKRRDPGAAENGAEGVLGLLNTAMKDLATHACPHACP